MKICIKKGRHCNYPCSFVKIIALLSVNLFSEIALGVLDQSDYIRGLFFLNNNKKKFLYLEVASNLFLKES